MVGVYVSCDGDAAGIDIISTTVALGWERIVFGFEFSVLEWIGCSCHVGRGGIFLLKLNWSNSLQIAVNLLPVHVAKYPVTMALHHVRTVGEKHATCSNVSALSSASFANTGLAIGCCSAGGASILGDMALLCSRIFHRPV